MEINDDVQLSALERAAAAEHDDADSVASEPVMACLPSAGGRSRYGHTADERCESEDDEDCGSGDDMGGAEDVSEMNLRLSRRGIPVVFPSDEASDVDTAPAAPAADLATAMAEMEYLRQSGVDESCEVFRLLLEEAAQTASAAAVSGGGDDVDDDDTDDSGGSSASESASSTDDDESDADVENTEPSGTTLLNDTRLEHRPPAVPASHDATRSTIFGVSGPLADPLYDPNIDDENCAWMASRGGRRPASSVQGGTSAVSLCCPACFTIVALACSNVAGCATAFRCTAARHVCVDADSTVDLRAAGADSKQARGLDGSPPLARRKRSAEDSNSDAGIGSSDLGSSSGRRARAQLSDDDMSCTLPVSCSTCHTFLGGFVQRTDEYVFTSVVPGEG